MVYGQSCIWPPRICWDPCFQLEYPREVEGQPQPGERTKKVSATRWYLFFTSDSLILLSTSYQGFFKSYFINLFKESNSGFLNPLYMFSVFFLSALIFIFIISFHLLPLGLICCSFSNFLRWLHSSLVFNYSSLCMHLKLYIFH